jgi:hypothetical protein
MAVARQTSVRIDPAKLMRLIERAIESPKARATLARVANDESRKIVVIAQQLANDELHRRPANRRTKASLEHGAEYHDSFVVIPADTSNPSKIRAGVTNLHPAAGIIENGSPPHEIQATGSPGRLVFPWDPPSTAGGIRQVPGKSSSFRQGTKGVFPVNYGEAPTVAFNHVKHPGSEPKRILARAADRYRKSTRHNVKAKSTL